jgi:hypothetical protein
MNKNDVPFFLTSIKPENNRAKHCTKKYHKIGACVAKYDSVVRACSNESKANNYTYYARWGDLFIFSFSLRLLHFSRTECRVPIEKGLPTVEIWNPLIRIPSWCYLVT